MDALDNGYRWKVSMYWGSKWKVYFSLYYTFTYDGAIAALDSYAFPVAKNKGWAIENLVTQEVFFERRKYHQDNDHWEPPDEGTTEAFNQNYEEEEPPPLELPPPTLEQSELFPQETFKSVWRDKPKTKRRL